MTNEKVNRDEYARFLEEENRSVESETREECLVKLEMMGLERDSAIARANRESRRADMEAGKAANAEKRADDAEKVISNQNQEIAELKEKLISLRIRLSAGHY